MANIQEEIGTLSQIAAGHSDQELIDRFVAVRDEAAFARLVERHGGTIWRLCRRILHKEHDAEDAYQAVFIVLSRKASSIRKGEAVGGWLYSIAYRIAMKARKSSQRRKVNQQQSADVARENPPWSEATLREMQVVLDEEVHRLAEKFRSPFVLCCLEGMSKPEAARELSWPEETVKARLAQARKLLQNRLVRRGITLTAVLTAVMLTQNTATAAAPAVVALSVGASMPVSSSALAMAEGFISGMGMSKFKVSLAFFLAMTMSVAGAGLTAYYFGSDVHVPEAPKAAVVFNDPEMFLAPPTPLMKAHDEQVLAVAISPNGKRLVTAGARQPFPGQFIIWDIENQKELVRIRNIRGIRGVAFAPDGKTIACGAFGGYIHLRDGETGKDRNILEGHKIGVNAVAYSANGDLLASAGLDRVVKLWDVKLLAEKRSFVGHTDMVFSVAFFRHGKAIVTGGRDSTAKIWDIDSGKVKFNLTGHGGAVETVAVSPNDKTVATASWDGTIKLWNAETGKEEAVLPGEGSMYALAFSHDGALLAGASADGSTFVWDVHTRQTVKRLEKHGTAVWSLAFTPNRKVLATGSSDKTAKLWDVETGKEIATLITAELKRVRSIAYAPDGKSLAVAGDDQYVQVRDARNGNVRHVLAGHSDLVNCVAISPDGATLASGSNDKTIKLWDLATGKVTRTITGHTGAVLALAFAKDGKLASAGEDELVKWWDLAEEKEPVTFKGHENAVQALAFAPDGASLASGGGDRIIRIWTLGKDAPSRILEGHTASVRALAFASDGLLASAGDDSAVRLWDRGADKASHTLNGHDGPVLSLAFTPGGRTLVSGGADKKAIVWDPATGTMRIMLSGHMASVTAVSIHPQGEHLLTGSDDSTLLRWQSSASTTPARTLKGNPEGVWFAQYSPANDRLATGGADGAVTIWARSLVPAMVPYPALDGVFWDADFAPNGRTIAVARESNVQILDIATGLVLRTIPMGKPVRSVKFSADKKYLVATTGSPKAPDGLYEAKLFDAVTGKELAKLDGHKGIVLRAAFSPDGKTLATSGADRTTMLWDLPSGKLRATLQTRSALAKGLLFLPDGTLVTSGWDKTIRFWDVEAKSEKKKWDVGLTMTTLAVSADGSLLAAAEHPSPGEGAAELKVWNVATGKVVLNPKGHTARILGLAFTPNGQGLLASGGKLNSFGEIHYWDLATGQLRGAHITPNQWIENVLVSPDSRRVASSSSSALRFWDLEFLHNERTWMAHSNTTSCGVFANGGATLVTASWDKSIKVWDVRDGRLMATLNGHTKPVHALALLPDGKTIASAGDDSTVKLWDLSAAREMASLEAHTKSVHALAVSPDGKTLASGGGDLQAHGPAELILWNLDTRKPRKTFHDIERAILSLTYSPDGKSLAASLAAGHVRVWSTDNYAVQARIALAAPRPLTFSPDGRLLAVGEGKAPSNTEAGTGSVRVWDTATWKERSSLEKHRHLISSVAFSPDGQSIASAGQDGAIKLHPTPHGSAPSDGPRADIGDTDPAIKPEARTEYHVPLKGQPENLPQMKLVGANADSCVRFEPTGLRITLAPGFEGSRPQIGLSTGIALKGDFEITVNYEILKLPEPEEAGSDTPVALWLWRINGNRLVTGVSRRVVVSDGHQLCAFSAKVDQLGKTTHIMGETIPTATKTGRLRLVRIGSEMSYFASEGSAAEFNLINQFTVGDQDMDDVRLIASTCDSRGSLDARFSDLRIRTGTFPRTPVAPANAANPKDPTDPTGNESRNWLAAVAVLAFVLALLASLSLLLRWRRYKAADIPLVEKPATAVSSVAFSCICGKPLKAKAGLVGKKLKCPGCGAPVLVPDERPERP